MKYPMDIFLGVKTRHWNVAKPFCEALIGHQLECTTSTFYGGRHCHVTLADAEFDLRRNHFDDGLGWRWCVNEPRYPLVLSCYFRSPAARERILTALHKFELIEVPSASR